MAIAPLTKDYIHCTQIERDTTWRCEESFLSDVLQGMRLRGCVSVTDSQILDSPGIHVLMNPEHPRHQAFKKILGLKRRDGLPRFVVLLRGSSEHNFFSPFEPWLDGDGPFWGMDGRRPSKYAIKTTDFDTFVDSLPEPYHTRYDSLRSFIDNEQFECRAFPPGMSSVGTKLKTLNIDWDYIAQVNHHVDNSSHHMQGVGRDAVEAELEKVSDTARLHEAYGAIGFDILYPRRSPAHVRVAADLLAWCYAVNISDSYGLSSVHCSDTFRFDMKMLWNAMWRLERHAYQRSSQVFENAMRDNDDLLWATIEVLAQSDFSGTIDPNVSHDEILKHNARRNDIFNQDVAKALGDRKHIENTKRIVDVLQKLERACSPGGRLRPAVLLIRCGLAIFSRGISEILLDERRAVAGKDRYFDGPRAQHAIYSAATLLTPDQRRKVETIYPSLIDLMP